MPEQSKHSERLIAMLERIATQLTESETIDLRKAVVAIQRLETGQGFQVVTAVTKDATARVDVTWMGMLANIEPALASQIGTSLIEAASMAEIEAGLIRFMRDDMSLDMAQAGGILAQFREYRKKPTDRPRMIHSPFGQN